MSESLTTGTQQPFAVRKQRLRTSITLLSLFVLAGAVAAYFPRLHGLLWQLPIYIIPPLVSVGVNWRRLRNPASLPLLSKDSAEYLRLRTIKRIFGWSFLATIIGCFAIVAITDCGCDHASAGVYAFVIVLSTIGLSFMVLMAYIKERTTDPSAVIRTSGWPSRRASPSEFKPFYSEHWGSR